MVRILSNEDLESVCDPASSIDALYEGFKAYSQGNAVRRPRIDLLTPTARRGEFNSFSTMDGVIAGSYYALRIKPDIISWPEVDGHRRRVTYAVRPGRYGGLILLFRAENAELVAIMNDGYIQHLRVAATSALGVKYLAIDGARTVGMLGTGGMAHAFLPAYKAVRPIERVHVFSPNREHVTAFCAEMSEKLLIDVVPMAGPEEAVRNMDIVACCTNSMSPLLFGEWLRPGMHLDRVHREFDSSVYSQITLTGYFIDRDSLQLGGLADDNLDFRLEALAYIGGQPEDRERIPMPTTLINPRSAPRNVREMVDWKTGGAIAGRKPEDLTFATCFRKDGGEASGMLQGIQFAAVAGRAYELAAEKDLGLKLDTEMFLQDIPT